MYGAFGHQDHPRPHHRRADRGSARRPGWTQTTPSSSAQSGCIASKSRALEGGVERRRARRATSTTPASGVIGAPRRAAGLLGPARRDLHGVARAGGRRGPARTRRPDSGDSAEMAAVASSRSAAGRADPRRRASSAPRKALRDAPTTSGQTELRAARPAGAAASSCGRPVLAKPSPGSSASRSGAIPRHGGVDAARRARSRRRRPRRRRSPASCIERRVPAPVHADVGDPERRDRAPASPSSAQSAGDVVDDHCARLDGLPGDLGPHGVDADDRARGGQGRDDRAGRGSSSSSTRGRSHRAGSTRRRRRRGRRRRRAARARVRSQPRARATCRRRRTSPA